MPKIPDILPLDLPDIPALAALWEVCGLTRPWNDPQADARLAIARPPRFSACARVMLCAVRS